MFTIRKAVTEDASAVAAIDAACFPGSEAADEAVCREKIRYCGDRFWVVCDGEKPISYLNGFCTDSRDLLEEEELHPSCHQPEGAWQMFCGMATLPEYRGQGAARMVMNHAVECCRKEGRKGCVLLCKDHLVPFYKSFGFVNEGKSGNCHAGVAWNQMRMTF